MKIYDPATETGKFLIEAMKYIEREQENECDSRLILI
jgi:type I restriction-modification system DNA methylase subunit